MRRVGQARKRDANEQDIVDALCDLGAVVFRLSAPGCPDLLVGYHGRWLPMEVKAPTGQLTSLQWEAWNGCPYPIVRSIADAVQAIRGTR